MPTTRIILALLLLLGAASSVPAQTSQDNTYFARAWTAEDGLPENKVIGVAQSPDGYLWVATLGGLVRFDGVRFQPFEAASTAGYTTSTMRVLQADRSGRLWLAKEGGAILCIDGTQVRAWTTKDGLPPFEGARSIAEDNEGGIWVAYTRGTVVRLKNSHVDFFTAKDGLPATGGCWLATDRNGQLWFAKNGCVGVFRGGKFVTLLNLTPHYVRIAPARNGGVWICSGVQLLKFNEGEEPVTLGQIPAARPGIELSALLEDREGALWIGTAADGLFRFAGGDITSVDTSYHSITCLAEDREGNLWAGTRGGGLNRLQRRIVSLSGPAAGLPFEAVQSLCQDASGALWAIGQNNVLARREENRWTVYALNEAAPATHAICLAADAHGKVWVGSERGNIYEWQDGQFKKLDVAEALHREAVRSLFATPAGDLWIATDGATDTTNALYRLRAGNVTKFTLPSGYRFIRAMAEDAAGNLWAGASDGLLVRVTGDVLSDETAKSSRYSIRCLHGAADGSLWIGYAGFGAGRLHEGRLTRFSADQGMPNDYVSQILTDGRGGVWFAGNQGVFMVREHEFDDVAEGRATHIQPVLYGRSEGLPNLQANFDYCPNAVRSADGHLYFSMLTGVAEIQPDQRRPNRFQPVVLIERVAADNRTFAVYQDGKMAAGTNAPADLPVELKDSGVERELKLPPGIQQLEIEFSALSFVAPENVQFRYQLEGFDRTWVEAGTRRVVHYTRVPPGKYHFKVVACNNDGIWNETGTSLAITVLPHIWETFWFKSTMTVAAFGGLCGSVVLVLRRRHRLQIQRLEEQRSLERERTRIARDLHDDLGVGLTEIGLLGDLACTPTVSPETSREYSHEITGRARDLVALLDEIVWAINPANDTAQSLSDYFFRFAQTLLQRASIRCRLEVVEPFPSCGLNAEQRHQLFLAFKEALNNIIRHSGATEVKVSLSVADGQLRICLVDNGHGIKTMADETSHDGLVGMEKRLQRLGGRCEIVSTVTTGTSVTLSIPIGEQNPS